MATKQDVVEVGCGYSGSATPRSSSPAFRRGHGFIWAGAWWGGLMPEQPPEPNGLFYQPDFITQAEEQQVLDVLQALEFHPITMPGRTAQRTVRHFGLDYGYESWKLVPTDPLPHELGWLQERAAALAGLDPEEFAQISSLM
jgi:hypothetical protein